MRILILHSNNIFFTNSASSNRWRTIVEGLSNNGISFHFIITSGYVSSIEKLTFGTKGSINRGITYQYISRQNRYGYLRTRLNIYFISHIVNWVSSIYLRKIVKRINPEIVFLFPSYDPLKVYLKAFRNRVSNFLLMTELNEYNDIWDIHTTNHLQRLRNKRFNKLLTQYMFKELDICLVMTDVLRQHYGSFQGLKHDISFLKVPMTVDLNRFNNLKTLDCLKKPYIAYCGSGGFISNGVDILIKSFIKISNEFPNLKLYIAAFWGQDGARMLELIKENEMTERIFYIGPLPRESIPYFLFGAEILALPRPDSRQAQGGFPTKLGEYLASGKPVCVTKVGEIPMYLQDKVTAFFAEPGSIESFASSLKTALTNRRLAIKVGKNGRRVAETVFNMDVQVRYITDFLKEKLRYCRST